MAIYEDLIGQEEGVGEWVEVDQSRINMFADATLDHQFIHIDPPVRTICHDLKRCRLPA